MAPQLQRWQQQQQRQQQETARAAEQTFDVFSSAPTVAQQWATILKTFLQQVAEITSQVEQLIQESRMDLVMRVQGRRGKAKRDSGEKQQQHQQQDEKHEQDEQQHGSI